MYRLINDTIYHYVLERYASNTAGEIKTPCEQFWSFDLYYALRPTPAAHNFNMNPGTLGIRHRAHYYESVTALRRTNSVDEVNGLIKPCGCDFLYISITIVPLA